MSQKLGFILSLTFFFQVILFGIDIINLQNTITKLDLAATSTRYLISRDKNFDAANLYLQNSINGEIECIQNCYFYSKQITIYQVKIKYRPIFLSFIEEEKTIITTRSVYIEN